MSIQDKIVIIDDKGKEQTFNNFQDFVNYVDSFYMPFLPDGFSYKIEEDAWDISARWIEEDMKENPHKYEEDA